MPHIPPYEVRTGNLAATAFLQRNGFPILRFEKNHRGPGMTAVFDGNATALLEMFLDDLTEARRTFERATAEFHEQAKRELANTRPPEYFDQAAFLKRRREELAKQFGVEQA